MARAVVFVARCLLRVQAAMGVSAVGFPRAVCPSWARPAAHHDLARGLATTPISEPVAVRLLPGRGRQPVAVRRLLPGPGADLAVQMMPQTGYGTPARGTPRRLLTGVLLLPSADADPGGAGWRVVATATADRARR